MMGFKHILFLLGALGLMSACVPQPDAKQECKDGQIHNAALRTCVPASALGVKGTAPVGVNQTETVIEDTPFNFTILGATDLDGDALFYVLETQPTHGTISNCMNQSGSDGLMDISCTYTPHTNYYGTDSFKYRLSDGSLNAVNATTVNFVITPVNDGPTLASFYPILIEDTSYNYTFHYTDAEGNLATSCHIVSSRNLTLGPCSCTMGVCKALITPDANENSNYPQVFDFFAWVSDGTVSNTIHEIVTVTPVNDVPVITPVSTCTTTLAQDTALTCSTPGFTDADSGEVPAQTHTWGLYSSNTCSWITINPTTGAISGQPNNENVGNCNFVYKITDSAGGVRASLPIAITVTNSLPNLSTVAPLTTPTEDIVPKQVVGKISSDPGCTEAFCLSGDSVQYGTLDFGTNTTCNANGSLELVRVNNTNFNILYKPNADYASSTPCVIEITYDDGKGASTSAQANMLVNEVNDKPTISPATIATQTAAQGTSFIVDINNPITIDEGGGADEDAQNLTILITSNNTTLIPHSTNNIQIYSDAAMTSAYNFVSSGVSGVTFNTTDGDQDLLYINLTGASGQSGTASITITVTDNGTNSGVAAPLFETRSFTVNINNSSVIHKDWNDIYAVGTKMIHNGSIVSAPVVRLGWNAFQAVNDTVAGYWVYRADSASGPFVTPLNSTMLSTSTRTYTDTSLTHSDSGRTYYYQVRAVSGNYGTIMTPAQSYATLKVPVPLANMSLMHRRMVNYRTCLGMGQTVDINSNNRCSYVGPGDNYSGYYDIGHDYFVDRYEASCNYTVDTTNCTETFGVGCIGTSAPTMNITDPSIYYNRSTGVCYYGVPGPTWKAVSTLTAAELVAFQELNQTKQDGSSTLIESTFPKRPPLVNIQQFKANNYCKSVDLPPGLGVAYKTLTSRQIHVAAAEWPSSTTGINQLEAGTSLSLVSSQCNASSGGALNFQNSLLGPLYDTWTATETAAASSHSFVMAGSDVTKNCESRYGIQDLAGNVEEWNLDRWFSRSNQDLFPIGISLNPPNDWSTPILEASYNPYSYYAPSTRYTFITAAAPLVSYPLSSGVTGALHTYLPFSFAITHTSPSPANLDFLLSDLAAGNGNFNGDYIYFGTGTLSGGGDFVPSTGELSGITSGGNFSDGTGAGRYSMRFRTVCHDADNNGTCAADPIQAFATEENVSTGFRCMIKLP